MPPTHYELLGIGPSAQPDEVKRAFRREIARYHPDKVQHLGVEFQVIAADRATALTKAYGILSDPVRRADYDRLSSATAGPPSREHVVPPPVPPNRDGPPRFEQFAGDQAQGHDVVRRATLGRFRQALLEVGKGYVEATVSAFDVACVPKSTLFKTSKQPVMFARFVARVDGITVAQAWTDASKRKQPASHQVCLFLIGPAVAPRSELADAIADQRRKPSRDRHLTLIAIDARDWTAHVPADAPPIVNQVLTRLRSAT